MKKFFKWFCLFMIYGFFISILQANNASNDTITLCSAALLIIIFLLWKFKKNKKETPQENHTETLNKEYGKSIKTSPKTKNSTTNLKSELSFEEDFLGNVIEDDKTIKEHMQEDLKNVLNSGNNDIDDCDEDEDYVQSFLELNNNNRIRELADKMIIHTDSKVLHPDEIINMYEEGIAAYYELKKYCYSLGKHGKTYFKDMWQHCHNSKNPDFDFVDNLKDNLNNYKNNYDKHLDTYNKTVETLQRTSNPLEEKVKRHYDPDAWYVRIDDRVNIYANDTNTYISTIGQKCINFENSLLEYADAYKKSLCPYCKQKIELPKQRKNCTLCKQKMYVVKGGIRQGIMVLKEDDQLKLKKLRKDFQLDKKYNPNYGHGIVVEDSRILIEDTKKQP